MYNFNSKILASHKELEVENQSSLDFTDHY